MRLASRRSRKERAGKSKAKSVSQVILSNMPNIGPGLYQILTYVTRSNNKSWRSRSKRYRSLWLWVHWRKLYFTIASFDHCVRSSQDYCFRTALLFAVNVHLTAFCQQPSQNFRTMYKKKSMKFFNKMWLVELTLFGEFDWARLTSRTCNRPDKFSSQTELRTSAV